MDEPDAPLTDDPDHIDMDDSAPTDVDDPAPTDVDDPAPTDADEGAGNLDTEPPGVSAGPRRLRRSTSDHMLAGVAGGIAEYFSIDPIIVRIAFVVLTVLGGVGLVLYGSGWLLMTEWDRSDTPRELFGGSRRHQAFVAVAAIIVGVVIIDFLAKGPFWIGDGWRVGQAFGSILVAGIVGYLVFRGVRGPISIGRIARRVCVGCVTLVAAVLVIGVGAELLTGVPLSGGFGSRSWRPTSVAEVTPVYRVGAGSAVLDLSQVHFPTRAVHVVVSVGVGHLLVEVPAGVKVSLTARSGIGAVTYGTGGESAFLADGQRSSASNRAAPLLVLDAQAGIGEVELVRSTPTDGLAIAPIT